MPTTKVTKRQKSTKRTTSESEDEDILKSDDDATEEEEEEDTPEPPPKKVRAPPNRSPPTPVAMIEEKVVRAVPHKKLTTLKNQDSAGSHSSAGGGEGGAPVRKHGIGKPSFFSYAPSVPKQSAVSLPSSFNSSGTFIPGSSSITPATLISTPILAAYADMNSWSDQQLFMPSPLDSNSPFVTPKLPILISTEGHGRLPDLSLSSPSMKAVNNTAEHISLSAYVEAGQQIGTTKRT